MPLIIPTGMQSHKRSPEELALITATFESFLTFCKQHSIPVVVAAGNQPTVSFVDDSYPQRLLLPDAKDAMIIVGGVAQDGKVWQNTVLDPDKKIAVSAPAENVVVPKSGGVQPDLGEQSGTSHAAAIVVCRVIICYDQL
jgi:hypothetical protein